ncbi:MAG: alpha/beta hydrolase [Treponema sp.]|nr:alpha/beta hydrolase [Treponema sp.]
MRAYPPSLLEALRKKQHLVRERGIDILVKPIPDDDRPGAMDRRLLEITEPVVRGLRGFFIQLFLPLFLKNRNPRLLAAFMRRFFNGVQSLPLAEGVSVRHDTVRNAGVEIPVRVYRREGGAAPRPVFYYIHGGGFAAGHPDVVEEIVKQVTALSGCVGVQLDYRLAPEHPYPASLDDCYAVLKWIYQNAASLGGDKNRICISGDSAGGNLAAVCAMKDRDEGAGMVRSQVLLYPTVNLAGREDENYRFSLDQFTILKEHRRSILFRIKSMRCSSEGVLGCVLGLRDQSPPYVSPYLGNLAGLPPCLIAYAEFDCLGLESEAYARKLAASGVPVRVIRYLGLGHAFAEFVGVQPQAEDCMAEIGRFVAETGREPA